MIEPRLRFKADDGSDFPDWEEKILGDVAECLDNKRVPVNAEDRKKRVGTVPYYGAGGIQGYIDEYLFDEELVLLLEDGDAFDDFQVKSIAQYITGKSWVNNHAHVLRAKDNAYFLFASLEHKDIRRWTQLAGASRKKLLKESMLKITIMIPSLPEQQKIADFLSTIDTIIEKQRATVSAWEERKKGVMQKLFSQEVRFKADDGSDFPDWEECTVGELFVPVVKKNKDGSIQNVITNSAQYGLIPQRDFFDKDIAIKENTSNYTIIQNGDFVYNPRKSTTAPFGPFNIYERDEAGIVSPLYTCLTPKYKEMTPYLSWYFRTNKWHPYIVTHGAQSGARHDRVGMTATLMNGIPVIYPSLPEQQKIADCLSALDAVIEKQKETLEKWQELKKGLLQQMFV